MPGAARSPAARSTVSGRRAQRSGMALAEWFNHNDLYHLIQLIALYLFYRGARLLQDRRGGVGGGLCGIGACGKIRL